MTEVVSVKFNSCGKSYFFAPPQGQTVKLGDTLVVDTAKGLETAVCSRIPHMVDDEAVVQPLRNAVRVATEADMKTIEQNKVREKEAFSIALKKIEDHGLDMKLVSTECAFEGGKITFFFTSDGRVDFRELVKDLASTFHSRIELRQIGVRDEARMLGGIGICGRPYCCSEFLDDFAPVSTKMAKVQNLSLNPTKISGSCGRLMCCLRYEQDAYEELNSTVPRQGAYVETPDGYGTAVSVNILRQQVKVALDIESSDSTRLYKANQVAAVPGGKPKDGEKAPHVLNYDPSKDKEDEPLKADVEKSWEAPFLIAETPSDSADDLEAVSCDGISAEEDSSSEDQAKKKKKRRYWYSKGKGKGKKVKK